MSDSQGLIASTGLTVSAAALYEGGLLPQYAARERVVADNVIRPTRMLWVERSVDHRPAGTSNPYVSAATTGTIRALDNLARPAVVSPSFADPVHGLAEAAARSLR